MLLALLKQMPTIFILLLLMFLPLDVSAEYEKNAHGEKKRYANEQTNRFNRPKIRAIDCY